MATDWHDEFRTVVRTTRPGQQELADYLKNSWPVRVRLLEGARTTTISVTLPVSSRALTEKFRAAHAHSELSLADAFDEIVWNPQGKGGRESFWAQLAKVAHRAHCEAWFHFLRTLYVGHFGDAVDQSLRVWLLEIVQALSTGSAPGRRRELDAERESLRKAFRRLLSWCRRIHQLVSSAVTQNKSVRDVRSEVFKSINGDRHDHDVLGGLVFMQIPYSKATLLHDPQSWNPRQLAIALLALERSLQYKTIERKLGRPRRRPSVRD